MAIFQCSVIRSCEPLHGDVFGRFSRICLLCHGCLVPLLHTSSSDALFPSGLTCCRITLLMSIVSMAKPARRGNPVIVRVENACEALTVKFTEAELLFKMPKFVKFNSAFS
jgi:hypothetical protein